MSVQRKLGIPVGTAVIGDGYAFLGSSSVASLRASSSSSTSFLESQHLALAAFVFEAIPSLLLLLLLAVGLFWKFTIAIFDDDGYFFFGAHPIDMRFFPAVGRREPALR